METNDVNVVDRDVNVSVSENVDFVALEEKIKLINNQLDDFLDELDLFRFVINYNAWQQTPGHLNDAISRYSYLVTRFKKIFVFNRLSIYL
jgi:hypothetical protein